MIFQNACSFTIWQTRYGDDDILNATISDRILVIRYDNSAHVGDGCRQKLCIQNCGQTAAYRNVQRTYS